MVGNPGTGEGHFLCEIGDLSGGLHSLAFACFSSCFHGYTSCRLTSGLLKVFFSQLWMPLEYGRLSGELNFSDSFFVAAKVDIPSVLWSDVNASLRGDTLMLEAVRNSVLSVVKEPVVYFSTDKDDAFVPEFDVKVSFLLYSVVSWLLCAVS